MMERPTLEQLLLPLSLLLLMMLLLLLLLPPPLLSIPSSLAGHRAPPGLLQQRTRPQGQQWPRSCAERRPCLQKAGEGSLT